ncbi:MAG: hypothetical protein E6H54_05005 [Betaproteobacteria bacterium]|nr:MAG: hypothetical protein E6H54_05005 [Betaproteobacteria bacterium]
MDAPLLSVTETKDGVWSVNERGPSRVAIAYFPSKWGALKHAVRVAHAKPRCRVAVLERDGTVRLAREYTHENDDHHVEL